MAGAEITKKALAASLKKLMIEKPFEKISISDICDGCGMKRKSFYYHFKDKYDLLDWIFDSDMKVFVHENFDDQNFDNRMDIILNFCTYFYENREFYRKAVRISGQNSLADHAREYLQPLFEGRIRYLTGSDHPDEFAVRFFADACIIGITDWLEDTDCMPPDQFISKLFPMIVHGIEALSKDISSMDAALILKEKNPMPDSIEK
ncbi:MAG: dihydroxyacetone kinase transcriptional activator DhaS [Erysipelotrichaceae bacterium]|nr:dihydroxyacetone kinase transcriptional activator DhaS [Erysipelotrichaceae bacterium]